MNDQNKRLFLAMVLSAIILIVWQTFFAPPIVEPPAEGSAEVTRKSDGEGATGDAAQPEGEGQQKAAAPVVVEPAKKVEVQSSTLRTPDVHVELSNRGGRLTGFELQRPEQYQKAGDLLAATPEDSKYFPFEVTFQDQVIALPSDVVYEVVEAPEQGGALEVDGSGKPVANHKVAYRYVDPGKRFMIDKIYTVLTANPYTIELTLQITNLTADKTFTDRVGVEVFGYKDPTEEKFFLDFRPDELEGICRTEADTERALITGLDKGEAQNYEGSPVSWVGVGTRYFFWGIIPEVAGASYTIEKVDEDYVGAKLVWPSFTLAPKGVTTFRNTLYTGPKDIDVFGEIGHDLNETVDYGILTILAKPMRWLLNKFFEFTQNWGLAIILLTLLIKIVTWPFMEKSYANAEKMKKVQPELEALRKTYENDQQRLSEETMKLFAERGFNPLGGCLPMLLQMPILYALYVMIMNSVELYQAEFYLWYTDLSAPDPYFVLPILMGAMMIIQQKFMSAATPNPQTKLMMQIMPVMFTGLMLFLPSGLVLYYSLNLVLGVLQQYLIRRRYAKADEEEAAAAG
ncbi:MAG: membrane protein insertase YidC [Myxococcota bacterium]